MLGILLTGGTPYRAFTWESAIRTLCMQRELELSTRLAAIEDKRAERLSQVYPAVIRRRDRDNTETYRRESGRF